MVSKPRDGNKILRNKGNTIVNQESAVSLNAVADSASYNIGQNISPNIMQPEFEEEIPLTIDTARPTNILNTERTGDEKAKSLVEQFGIYDQKLELSSYKYPSLDLLENYGSNNPVINSDELEANKTKIVEVLNCYGIGIDKIAAIIGPRVTLYEINPAQGIRISKIKNLENDIALSLAATNMRIIAPMPGKGTIGIELQNSQPTIVSMRSVLASEKFQTSTMAIRRR